MSSRTLWILAVLLTVGPLYLMFVVLPGTQSDVARRGIKATGQVRLKDSRPMSGGGMEYNVTFIFEDTMKRNHQVTRVVYDKGAWDRLMPNTDVKVYFTPENPDGATLEGGAGMASPHSAAFSFLGWSLFAVGVYLAYAAIKAARAAAPPGDKPQKPRKVIYTRK
jgi:hypothetical protein